MDKIIDYTNLTGPIPYQLTNDYMFRAVMQKNKKVLTHLVAALLMIPVEMIINLELLNPIILGENIDAKTCILDIKILLNNNQYINIEMQVSKQEYWKERSLTYLCRTFDNLDSGQEYNEVIPALQISILDFDLFENIEELCSNYYLMNVNPEYHNYYTDKFGILLLNLHQINNEKVIKQEGDSELYQWAKLFKAKSWEEIRMLAEKNEAINECVYTMAELSEDDKIRMQCEARNDYIAKEKGVYSRGHKEGLQQGIQLTMLQVYHNMINNNIPEEQARKLSGVTDEMLANEKKK